MRVLRVLGDTFGLVGGEEGMGGSEGTEILGGLGFEGIIAIGGLGEALCCLSLRL